MTSENGSSRKIVLLLLVVITILVILLLLLRGCEEEPTPDASPTPPVAGTDTPSASAAPEGEKGYVRVKASSEFTAVVRSGVGEGSEVVTEGPCGAQLAVPPGSYVVGVKPKGDLVSVGAVTVESGQTRELEFRGFGTLMVHCRVFQAPYTVRVGDQVIARGAAGVAPIGLAVGTYQVVMELGGLSIVKEVTIEENAKAELTIDEIGVLAVDCVVFQAPFEVLAKGEVVAEGKAGLSELPLPVGDYQVRMTIAGRTIVKDVTVVGNQTVKTAIDEIGQLVVQGLAFNHEYVIQDKGGAEVTKGAIGVTKVPLPAGDYRVVTSLAGQELTQAVKVEGGAKQELGLDNHGLLTVEGPEFNAPFTVEDEAGKKVAGGGAGVSKVPLPNGKYTVRCQGKSKPVTVAGDKVHVELAP